MTEPGFQFPCPYTIKAMGLADPDFDALVISLIRRHCDDIREGSIRSKASANGKYLSISVDITAQSREQLDRIYDELTAHDRILMRL